MDAAAIAFTQRFPPARRSENVLSRRECWPERIRNFIVKSLAPNPGGIRPSATPSDDLRRPHARNRQAAAWFYDIKRVLLVSGSNSNGAEFAKVTGKRPMTRNNVSHANNKTKRRFLPNLQYRRFWVSENRWVRLRVSTLPCAPLTGWHRRCARRSACARRTVIIHPDRPLN